LRLPLQTGQLRIGSRVFVIELSFSLWAIIAFSFRQSFVCLLRP
jgi:hypothetical protein